MKNSPSCQRGDVFSANATKTQTQGFFKLIYFSNTTRLMLYGDKSSWLGFKKWGLIKAAQWGILMRECQIYNKLLLFNFSV